MRTLLLLLFLSEFIFPSFAYASNIVLRPCLQPSHCVREVLNVNDLDQPFIDIKRVIENIPRSEIVELNEDYLHAEVTSRWMRYVDDLEVSYLKESNELIIRSESRLGDSDLGVNQNRVNALKSDLFK